MSNKRVWYSIATTYRLAVCFFLLRVVSLSQAPPTILQALQERHVDTSRAGLVEALHGSDKAVRGLAAAELAERKDTEALPMIVRAAQQERDGQTRLNLASAATWMGSPNGLLLVKDLCNDRSQSSWIRTNAARTAFERHDHDCFPALVEMMRSGETGARIEAMSAASQIHSMTDVERKTVLELSAAALADPDVGMRLQASQALRWLNREEGMVPLRKAIARESEESVRSQMEADLKYLSKEHSAP